MFEGQEVEAQDGEVLAMVQGLPLVYASLEESQKGDSWCQGLVQGLKKGDPAMNKFKIHNRLLCYQPKGAKTKRYVVPELLRSMLMMYFHDSPLSVHLGAFQTWNKVRCQFYWPKLKDDVFQYVRQCDLCQRAKPAQDMKVGLHTAAPASYNLERIFIDFMGPLVRTKKGNQAILVVMDSFSKFLAFYPVRNITSAAVCEVLENKYFMGYGVPKSFVSDNAKVFKSKVFYDFCLRWGIKRINTTPYYPQGSLTERVMRNLKAALKIFHHQSQVRWDENLHLLAFASNAAYHESTTMSPSKLFLGRELNTPLGNVWDLTFKVPSFKCQQSPGSPTFLGI
jgi:putative transposase